MLSKSTNRVRLDVGAAQTIGARSVQEDWYLYRVFDGATLSVVGDGVGGLGAGNVASQLMVLAYEQRWLSLAAPAEALTRSCPTPDVRIQKFVTMLQAHPHAGAEEKPLPANASPAQLLRAALRTANQAVGRLKQRVPKLTAMASTCVAVTVDQNNLWWLSVGDSHLYLIRDNKLKKLNAVHNFGAYLDQRAQKEAVTEQENLSRRHLTSVVEGGTIPLIDCPEQPLQLEAGDLLLIGSDGLDVLSPGKIIFSAMQATAQACATELIAAVDAVRHPSQDNTTAVVIKVLAVEDEMIDLSFGGDTVVKLDHDFTVVTAPTD